MIFSRLAIPILVGSLGILPGACAPQPSSMVSPASSNSLAGTPSTMPGSTSTQDMSGMDQSNMSRTSGMDRSNMQGMDMNTMMARCSQMRQQMRPGMAMPADMQQMMSRCDQMDRGTGTGTQRSR